MLFNWADFHASLAWTRTEQVEQMSQGQMLSDNCLLLKSSQEIYPQSLIKIVTGEILLPLSSC